MSGDMANSADSMLWALALSEAMNGDDLAGAHALMHSPPGNGTGLGHVLALVSLLIDLRASELQMPRGEAVADLRALFHEAAAQ